MEYPIPENYRELMFQDWHESEDRRFLRELAEEYYDRCDGFDNLHLTGPMGRAGRLPRDDRELAMCGRHASSVYRELKEKAMDMMFTAREWHDAIIRAGRDKRSR